MTHIFQPSCSWFVWRWISIDSSLVEEQLKKEDYSFTPSLSEGAGPITALLRLLHKEQRTSKQACSLTEPQRRLISSVKTRGPSRRFFLDNTAFLSSVNRSACLYRILFFLTSSFDVLLILAVTYFRHQPQPWHQKTAKRERRERKLHLTGKLKKTRIYFWSGSLSALTLGKAKRTPFRFLTSQVRCRIRQASIMHLKTMKCNRFCLIASLEDLDMFNRPEARVLYFTAFRKWSCLCITKRMNVSV